MVRSRSSVDGSGLVDDGLALLLVISGLLLIAEWVERNYLTLT
jgi:hypothetical protein